MKSFSLSLLIILVTSQLSFSQSLLTKKAAIEDLDILYSTINEVHPNPYTIISKKEFDQNFNFIKSTLKDTLSSSDFFALAAPLLHSIGDGHSCMYMPHEEFNRDDLVVFPYFVDINNIDSTLRISHDLTEDAQFGEIPTGAQIVSINGNNYKELITHMLSILFRIKKYLEWEQKTKIDIME